ncbi:acyl-CoA thioesterase [Immundisolibacter sp.]|nr:acyl-CoA thioesterase [Immundisolibacter sp.]
MGAIPTVSRGTRVVDPVLAGTEPAIRVLAMPADTNPAGDIFGGWIMAQMDLAGGILASRRAGGRVVTVAMNAFEFHHPVYVGDLLSCYGRVVRVGRTSLTLQLEAFAERAAELGQVVKVTEATATFVAVDEQRRPRPVPPLDAPTDAPTPGA